VTDLRKIEMCRACQAPIVWATTSAGKNMPVDAEPSDDGNVLLFPTVDHKVIAIAMGKREATMSKAKERYKSHFATCPSAASFRKGPRKAKP
jgi:hypothetical protein